METNQQQRKTDQPLVLTGSSRRLLKLLDNADKMGVANYLSQFKHLGVVKFETVLTINSAERIPAITSTKEGRDQVFIALVASLGSALANLNLRYGLNEDQIIELADQIIDQSHEDNLALEDVLLFLQQLITGKSGKIYDRLDIPTFFELFETYREERFQSLKNIRYEQQSNNKALGPIERVSEDIDKEKHREALSDHLKNMYKK